MIMKTDLLLFLAGTSPRHQIAVSMSDGFVSDMSQYCVIPPDTFAQVAGRMVSR
jgi:hypothetical protein